LNKGFNHTQVTVTIFLSSIILTTIGYFINYLNINLVAVILTLTFFSGVFVVRYIGTFTHLHVVDEKEMDKAKVLTLYGDENESKPKANTPHEALNVHTQNKN
jgi:hypothetical protein